MWQLYLYLFENLPHCFPQCSNVFHFVLENIHPNGYKVVPHCGFDLDVPDA